MNYGERVISSPNASSLLFSELPFVKVLVLVKIMLQGSEM
jgi:hypothetical protein